MKRLDKLILGAFLGPFFLTFSVALFIFLTQYLLRYLDDFVGKDLGFAVFSELIFYFSLNMVPNSLPLAILISSLMTFGNLGEHFELTAIKSSGISLVRTLFPIFIIVVGIAIGLFYFNNIIVPKANLNAYSLLYDIQHKKPAFDIKEGTFYTGLPGYSIKVTQKYPDGRSLKGVMIYDHTAGRGNTDVIAADSGYMHTFLSDKYLGIELFNGESYSEVAQNQGNILYPSKFVRTKFQKTKMVFSLAAFDLKRTQQELFASNKYMKNTRQLNYDVDSLRKEYKSLRHHQYEYVQPFFSYEFKNNIADTVDLSVLEKKMKSHVGQEERNLILNRAVNQARSVKSFTQGNAERLNHIRREGNGFEIEKYRKYAQSLACIIMFLIGAPLGAIIRKGGLGIPIFVGIVFFILYYVITMISEKWAKESLVEVKYGMLLPMFILLPVGLFFLNQARHDSRLFETDAYKASWEKLKRRFFRKSPEQIVK